MSNPPPIPSNNDPEFKEALSALVRSASTMRKVYMMVSSGSDPERIARDHGDTLLKADAVIEAWCAHLGIED